MSMVVVVANGDRPPVQEFQNYVRQADHLIAVDGGANHCLKLKLKPNLVLGDMDSISAAARKKFSSTAQFHEFPADKDDMDFSLALHAAQELGASQILAFAWSSVNPDYTYGNLRAASACEVPVILIHHHGWNTFLKKEFGGVEIYASDGTQKVSIFPFSAKVSLKTLGLKWELDWRRVSPDTMSQSNVLRDGMASIALTEGVAWVSVERPFV